MNIFSLMDYCRKYYPEGIYVNIRLRFYVTARAELYRSGALERPGAARGRAEDILMRAPDYCSPLRCRFACLA